MGDKAYKRALLRRTELQDELQRINLFISMYEDLDRDDGDSASRAAPNRSAPPATAPSPAAPRAPNPDAARAQMPQTEFERLVISVLQKRGSPANRVQMLEEFDMIGKPLGGGTGDTKLIGAKLWRARGKITHLKGMGYWLASEPYAPAGYMPPPVVDMKGSDGDALRRIGHWPSHGKTHDEAARDSEES